MALDALVTALACLSSTTPGLEPSTEAIAPGILQNSVEPFQIDNSTGGCPAASLGGFRARLQHISEEIQVLKSELNDLQQLINDYKSEAEKKANAFPGYGIEARFGGFAQRQPAPVAAVPIDNTPRDCWDQKHGQVRIKIAPNVEPFYVNCDQKERGGGWIVIADRFDGRENFYRDWQSYKSGFGVLNAEFFIGLEKLHLLTNNGDHELLIVMRKQDGEKRFALYDKFSIGNEVEKYMLYVLGTYTGDSGDSLRVHAGKKFTTKDQDNDDNGLNCARIHTGAWWYGRECMQSNLFGTFQNKYGQKIGYHKGILWHTFLPGPEGSLSYVHMAIRSHKKK